jgi:hypothetical protein
MKGVQTWFNVWTKIHSQARALRTYMQDIVVGKESLSAQESVKARMALTGVQLYPLPFRRRVQWLIELNFPNGSVINQFVPNNAGALRLEVTTVTPLLPCGSGGINICERQLTEQFHNRP